MKSPALVLLGASLLVALLIFAPSLGFPYLPLEDGAHVYANQRVLEGLGGGGWGQVFDAQPVWQPVTWMSHLVDSTFGGSVTGRRGMNLLLHLVNTILLFLVLRRGTGQAGAAAIAAALFALHPLRSEPVVWIAHRGALVVALFALLAAWFALRGQRIVAGVAAVMSLLAIPFRAPDSLNGWLAAQWFHARETFWPVDLAIDGMPAGSLEAGLGAAVLLLLAASGFLLRSRIPVAAYGLWWTAAAMALFFGAPARAGHGTYVAHLGLMAALVWMVSELAGPQRVVLARARVVLLLGLAGLTWLRNSNFRDVFALLTQTRTAAGLTQELQLSLAQLWFEAGNFAASEQEFREYLKRVPNSGDGWAGLGNTLLALKRQQDAADAFREGTRRAPQSSASYYGLGIAETNLNRRPEGTAALEKSLQLGLTGRPAAIACNNLGSFLAAEKKYPEAQKWFERAIEFDLQFVQAHRNLALVLNDQGKRRAAIAHLQFKALLWTNNDETLGRLNVDLMNLEYRDQAVKQAEILKKRKAAGQ